MSVFISNRFCIVNADKAQFLELIELAEKTGLKRSEYCESDYGSFIFGGWTRPEDLLVRHGDVTYMRSQRPHIPVFDAETQMEEIKSRLRGEPPFDESPLPYDMKPEQEQEIRKKFNISPDLMEQLTPSIKEALAGVPVVVEEVKIRWIPVTERLPVGASTVLVSASQGDAEGAMEYVSLAFLAGDGSWSFKDRHLRIDVTHWAPLPDSTRFNEDGTRK
jgi:hypothetical protein